MFYSRNQMLQKGMFCCVLAPSFTAAVSLTLYFQTLPYLYCQFFLSLSPLVYQLHVFTHLSLPLCSLILSLPFQSVLSVPFLCSLSISCCLATLVPSLVSYLYFLLSPPLSLHCIFCYIFPNSLMVRLDKNVFMQTKRRGKKCNLGISFTKRNAHRLHTIRQTTENTHTSKHTGENTLE